MMIFRIVLHAFAVVFLLMLAAHFLGVELVDTVVHHVTTGLQELGTLAKQLSESGAAGSLVERVKQLLGW